IRQLSPEKLLSTLLDYIADPYTTEYWTSMETSPEPVEGPQLGVTDAHVMERLRRIKDAAHTDRTYVLAALKETQERANSLVTCAKAFEVFLVDETPMDSKGAQKWLTQEHVPDMFAWIRAKLGESRVETVEHYDSVLRGYQTHAGFEKLGPVVHPV